MRVLVAGASGFVGRRLCEALLAEGHDIRAMTRHPDRYRGAGEAVLGDIADQESLVAALSGTDAVYYLVHSLESEDFARADADGARTFAAAAAGAGVDRIIYLGGLGDDADDLSPHLKSRREVEALLASTGVPVTTLRAGIIIGDGGISWEITRQLVGRLPAMITPRWVSTKTQPIAIDDVVRYLVGVLSIPETADRTFEIGGPDVLAYLDMMRRLAAIQGRRRFILPVPFLSPSLSSRWLSLITDVDTRTGRSLVDSMTNEVVARDTSIRKFVPFDPMGYDDAVRAALNQHDQNKHP